MRPRDHNKYRSVQAAVLLTYRELAQPLPPRTWYLEASHLQTVELIPTDPDSCPCRPSIKTWISTWRLGPANARIILHHSSSSPGPETATTTGAREARFRQHTTILDRSAARRSSRGNGNGRYRLRSNSAGTYLTSWHVLVHVFIRSAFDVTFVPLTSRPFH